MKLPVNAPSTHTNFTAHADQLHTLFSRLPPQDVEDFYNSYQQWMLQKHIQSLQEHIATIQQRIQKNAQLMAALQPTPTAHTMLARLHSHGVENIDVLDRLLEHDDSWLHHTLALLEQCEHLGFIQDDYTQWCEYALEGAYDWITSINITSQDIHDDYGDQQINETQSSSMFVAASDTQEDNALPLVTEEELLQKLMSDEEDETVKLPALQGAMNFAPTTMQTDDEANALETVHSNVQINSNTSPAVSIAHKQATITRPLPAITQPLPLLEEDVVGTRLIASNPDLSGEIRVSSPVETRLITPTTPIDPPSSVTVASPHRGPLWRLFNLLARFFFAT